MDRTLDEARRLLLQAQRAVAAGVDETSRWLATEQGRQFRRRFAGGLLLASPLLMKTRFFRAHPVGRLIEFAGGAALLVKLAEAIRDWEPGMMPRVVDTTGSRRPG